MQLYTTPLFCEYIKLPMSEEEKNKPRPSFSLSPTNFGHSSAGR